MNAWPRRPKSTGAALGQRLRPAATSLRRLLAGAAGRWQRLPGPARGLIVAFAAALLLGLLAGVLLRCLPAGMEDLPYPRWAAHAVWIIALILGAGEALRKG